MLQSPKVNVSNIMRVIESIKCDPEFLMSDWNHCICGHCHKVMGNINHNDDTIAALEFLGVPVDGKNSLHLFAMERNSSGPRDRDWALKTLNAIIAFDGVPSTVE